MREDVREAIKALVKINELLEEKLDLQLQIALLSSGGTDNGEVSLLGQQLNDVRRRLDRLRQTTMTKAVTMDS